MTPSPGSKKGPSKRLPYCVSFSLSAVEVLFVADLVVHASFLGDFDDSVRNRLRKFLIVSDKHKSPWKFHQSIIESGDGLQVKMVRWTIEE